MPRDLTDFLKAHDVEYKESLSLAQISPIKIGAEADCVAYPDSIDKLVNLVRFLWKNKIKHIILGRMSNILPSDKKYNGVVIRTDNIRRFYLFGNILTAECGTALGEISRFLCKAGFGGFEGLGGIPGSIGGSLVGNAGAFGYEISDCLYRVFAYDIHGDCVRVMSPFECNFSYRSSVFKNQKFVILSAEFVLPKSDAASVLAKMEGFREKRMKTQPYGLPSLGSTFKRPDKNLYAAKLIDDCGLRGFKMGGAEISEKHAGFIVNRGGASSFDYQNLMEYARKCVNDKYGIYLESEIVIMK